MINLEHLCMNCMEEHKGEGACPHCGFHKETYRCAMHHLPVGSILSGRYLIGKVLGEGGFGITYMGLDLHLQVKMAIKEYFPNGVVTRENHTTVYSFSGDKEDFFEKGKEKFLDEARALAKYRNKSGVVSVSDFFGENGTVYIVMEYIDGVTFKEYLAKMGGRLHANQVFDMMEPVMLTLGGIHRSGIIHRDISPDNLMITDEGTVKLLDFGAARDFTSAGNKSLSVMLKPGYAPEEQYRSRGIQGPWTDVYALCATMYRCITGITPEESNERMIEDTLQSPSQMGIAIEQRKEEALMKGLSIFQKGRQQNVEILYKEIYTNPEPVKVEQPVVVEAPVVEMPKFVDTPPVVEAAPVVENAKFVETPPVVEVPKFVDMPPIMETSEFVDAPLVAEETQVEDEYIHTGKLHMACIMWSLASVLVGSRVTDVYVDYIVGWFITGSFIGSQIILLVMEYKQVKRIKFENESIRRQLTILWTVQMILFVINNIFGSFADVIDFGISSIVWNYMVITVIFLMIREFIKIKHNEKFIYKTGRCVEELWLGKSKLYLGLAIILITNHAGYILWNIRYFFNVAYYDFDYPRVYGIITGCFLIAIWIMGITAWKKGNMEVSGNISKKAGKILALYSINIGLIVLSYYVTLIYETGLSNILILLGLWMVLKYDFKAKNVAFFSFAILYIYETGIFWTLSRYIYVYHIGWF